MKRFSIYVLRVVFRHLCNELFLLHRHVYSISGPRYPHLQSIPE